MLKEINGKALADIADPKDKTKVLKTAGQQLDGFGQLQDDGTTPCGNWIYSGAYTEAGNKTQRRNTADPTGLGMFHQWAFSWPANRRDPLQPGLGRRRRQALGPDPRRASSGTARSGSATCRT